jgi:hypothetical protein
MTSLRQQQLNSDNIVDYDEQVPTKPAPLVSETKTPELSNSKFYSSKYSVEPPDILSDESLHKLPDYLINGSCGVDRLVITIQLDPDSLVKDNFLSNILVPDKKTLVVLALCPNLAKVISTPDYLVL